MSKHRIPSYLDTEAERRRVYAEALTRQSGTPPQRPLGRIVANTGLADAALMIGSAFGARRLNRQADQIDAQNTERARTEMEVASGIPQSARISIEDPLGGPASTSTVPRALTDEQKSMQQLIGGADYQSLQDMRRQLIAQRLSPKPKNYGFVQSGDQVLRTDPQAGTAEPVYQQPKQPQRPNVGAVDPSKYTAASVQRFAQTNDYGDLVPTEGGGQSLKDRLGTAEGLRKEFSTASKDYRELTQKFTNIQTAAQNPSAAGDLSIIFSYMKILDPSSTVREGEQASAQNAAGVPTQLLNVYNRLLTGERLAPEQRADFVGQARSLYGARVGEQRQLVKQYSAIAQRAGVDVSDAILDAYRPAEESNDSGKGWSIRKLP